MSRCSTKGCKNGATERLEVMDARLDNGKHAGLKKKTRPVCTSCFKSELKSHTSDHDITLTYSSIPSRLVPGSEFSVVVSGGNSTAVRHIL